MSNQTFMTHVKWGGVYEFDQKTKQLTTILPCHHGDGSVTYDKFDYAYDPAAYLEITETEIDTIDPEYKTKMRKKPTHME